MSKEKKTEEIRVVVQRSLKEDFEFICEKKYKTTSESIRDLMLKYIQENADVISNKL